MRRTRSSHSGTARVMISKLGRPVEYNWSDFKRVTSFAGP